MTDPLNELLWNHANDNEDYAAAKELEVESSKIEILDEYNTLSPRRAISSRFTQRILAVAQQDNAEYARVRSADLLDAAEAAGNDEPESQ